MVIECRIYILAVIRRQSIVIFSLMLQGSIGQILVCIAAKVNYFRVTNSHADKLVIKASFLRNMTIYRPLATEI